ncbi:MAG: hypothetical protein AAFR74_05960 [Pseudomonadota bacterium]
MTEIVAFISTAIIGIPLVLWYVWRLGYFSQQADKNAANEIERSRINNKIEQIKARKASIEAGEIDEPLKPRSWRLRNKR